MPSGNAVETQIDISAPPKVAYKNLMAFDKYPDWNPFIKQISGDTKVGGFLEAQIQLPGNPSPMLFKPVILVNDENKEFRWQGTFLHKYFMTGTHYFICKPNGHGTTFVHGEEFGGLIGGLFTSLYGEKTKKGFESMNSALKELCEG